MKKRVFSLLLALCVTLGLLPAAMAADTADGTETQSASMTISARERTDTGLKFQVNLTEIPSDGALFAVIYASGGKMKELRPLTLQESVPVELDNVADSDIVRLILTGGEYKPLQYKQTSRPQGEDEFGAKESPAVFNSSLMSLIARPEFLSAAAEKELEETEQRAKTDPYAYRRLIVSMDGALPDVSGYGKPSVITDASSGYSILQFADEENAKACAAYLSALPTVQYVEPDILLEGGPKASTSFFGSDEADYKSWGATKIKADVLASYLQTLGDRSVTVAVADTGVEKDHPFVSKYLIKGFDFIENDDDPNDQHSHGTHVIGTVVDCMSGLNVKVMPVRVLGASGGGTATGIALGIRYAADNGANVLNLSLGGGHSNYLDDAIQYAINKGVTVVVAAGNDGGNVMEHCPAHIIPAITVAAVDSSFNKASFSNYGESVDVAAPGVQINSSVLNGDFAQKSGTSMASPHVAAAAAMLKYGYPDKTPEEIQQALKDTALDLGDPGWDEAFGYGLVNLEPFAKGEWPTEPIDQPDPGPVDPVDPVDPNTHTYELFDTGMEWEKAKAYCEQLDGHLMTVTSEAEQQILNDLLEKEGGKNSYWLGGYEVSEGVYQWITGESFTYTNWAPRQPDTEEENRLAAYRNENPYSSSALGQWNDVREDGSFPGQEDFFGLDNFGFICEWDGERPEPPTVGIFAILYEDGELVFQNNDRARQSKPVLETYPVDGATLQDASSPLEIEDDDGEITQEFGVEYAEWYDHADIITKVTILDKIQPTSTALWFHGCRNLESITGLEYLDTSKVTNMSHMFSKCYLLTDLDVSMFDTSNVTNMSHMFYGCKNLMYLNLESFDTSKVTDTGAMFSGCGELFRVYASDSFVTSAVTGDKNMFKNCEKIEGTFGTKYDPAHIDREYARLDDDEIPPVAPGYFSDRKIVPGKANVYLYDDGEMVFQLREGADANRTLVESYTIDVMTRDMASDYALWYDHRADIKTVTFRDRIRPFATSQWFYKCENLTTINNIENLDTRAVTDMSMMFGGCSALTSLNVSGFDTRKVTSMRGMFEDCAGLTALDVSAFNTANVTNMSAMFKGCSGLTTLSLDALDTSKVTDMSNMFRGCASLKALDLSSFKTDSLTNMSYMFRDCASMETLNVSAFDTSKITDMKYLFSGCASLKSLDLSAFNTANVRDMQHMFTDCAALTSIKFAFDTGKVTNMSAMFAGTGLTELDLHAFDTSAVTTMNGMFQGSSLVTLNLTQEDRSGWNTSAVTDMSDMFRDCSALKTVNVAMGTFSTDSVTSSDNMFTGAVSIVGGRGTAYDAAHIDKGYARIDFGKREPGYFTDPNMVILTFDANDSKEAPAEGVMEELLCSKGVAELIPANAFTREGYDFTGWNAKADGSGQAYAEGESITLTDDLTLYAQWMKKVVLTFDANDSAEDPAEGVMEQIIVSKGSKVELPANAFTREGYDFKGWNTKPDGTGTAYDDEAVVTLTDDLTLYAQWDYSFMENLYAILYSDGELVFQWNDKPAEGRTVVKTYITDRAGYSDNRAEQNNFRAWYNEAAQINTVTFAKRIQPNDIAQWFQGCYKLTTVNNLEKLDTALVKDMSNLFAECASLTEVNLRTFDTANVTNMESMFEGCESIRELDLSSFDTANVKYTESMFSGCEELTTILVSNGFVTGSVTDGDEMFMDCNSLVGGSGTQFDEDYTDVFYARVDGGTSNPGYFTLA